MARLGQLWANGDGLLFLAIHHDGEWALGKLGTCKSQKLWPIKGGEAAVHGGSLGPQRQLWSFMDAPSHFVVQLGGRNMPAQHKVQMLCVRWGWEGWVFFQQDPQFPLAASLE